MGLKITNAASGNAVLWLYGPIGSRYEGGITADEVRVALHGIPSQQNIDLHIHSEGGDYREGVAIHTNIKRRQGTKNVYIDSLAASAGSIVAMAGDSIEIVNGGWMMIHEVHASINDASAGTLRTVAEQMDVINQQIRDAYLPRWKGTENELREAMANELWLNPETAIQRGLADRIGGGVALAAHINNDMFNYKNIPEAISAERLPEKYRDLEEKLAAALS